MLLDCGSGSLDEVIENLWNSYEVICLTEDIKDIVSKSSFIHRLNSGYSYRVNNRSSIMLHAIEMGIPVESLITRCPLHNKGDNLYMWLEFKDHKDGIEFYIMMDKTL